jgi:hypothetical protein
MPEFMSPISAIELLGILQKREVAHSQKPAAQFAIA